MNKTFGKHIVDLLTDYECVVLPTLGSFILQKTDATFVNGVLSPSSKKIVFNKNINHQDSLLSASLIIYKEFNFVESKEKVKAFINEIKFYLHQNSYFEIEDLGTLRLSDNHEISFVSNTDINELDKNNFGLSSIHAVPIQREIIVEEVEVVDPVMTVEKVAIDENTTVVRRIRKSSLVGLVASIIFIFGIGTMMNKKDVIHDMVIQNANGLHFLNLDDPKKERNVVMDFSEQENHKKKKRKNLKKNKKMVSEEEIENESLEVSEGETSENNIDVEDLSKSTKGGLAEYIHENKELYEKYKDLLVVDSDNPTGYYVIIGSFSNLQGANKAKYECSVNNTCSIFMNENKRYRVGIFASNRMDQAIDIVEKYKKENPSYWLLANQ